MEVQERGLSEGLRVELSSQAPRCWVGVWTPGSWPQLCLEEPRGPGKFLYP